MAKCFGIFGEQKENMNASEILWAFKKAFDGTKMHFWWVHNGNLQTFDE
jgi:hypothetical protein